MSRPAIYLALVLLLALSCRSVPATLTLDEQSEPAPEPKVFVEDSAARDQGAVSPLLTPVSEEIANLYRCWFDDPYEYMFSSRSGATLEVGGRSFGMLMGGISGILYYGDFNECAGALVGQGPRSYSDFTPISALAGIPVTREDPNLPFDAVNPQIVTWARTTLLPPPHQYIDGVAVQDAYERVFRRFFQAMALSLLHLEQDRVIAVEAQTYLGDVLRGADGIDWLEGRYGASLPSLGGSGDGTTMTTAMAAGFWLRRELDGSLASCWHGLRDVLERYDPDWLDEQLANNPKAAATLTSLPDPLAGGGK